MVAAIRLRRVAVPSCSVTVVLERHGKRSGKAFMVFCPVCQGSEQIQKVSAIVANGSRATHTHGRSSGFAHAGGYFIPTSSTHSVSSFSQSNLAARLDFRSVVPVPMRWIVIGFVAFVLGLLGGDSSVVGAVILAITVRHRILPMRGLIGGLVSVAGMLALLYFAANFFGPELSGAAEPIAVYGGVLLCVGTVVQRIRHLMRHSARVRAWNTWNEMYFCFRDNAVFNPATGRYGPPGAAQSIAWES